MPKGFHTQCLAVLLKKPVRLSRVLDCLGNYEITAKNDKYDNWAITGPSCIIPFRPEVNGLATVDIVEQPWPDDLGNPETSPEIFFPWSLGAFGPAAFPGCLERAAQYSWQLEQAESYAEKHRAFIRARITYTIGAGGDEPVIPEDCDPVKELRFLTKMVRRILQLPEALCYFNPSGELLRDADYIDTRFELSKEHAVPPLDLWSSARCFDLENGWTMADMVGNYQMDLIDVEAYFADEQYDRDEVTQRLYDLILYMLKGPEMKQGETCDCAGDVKWKIRFHEESLADPSRHVMALSPCDDRPKPETLVNR
jgi:Domain of unknown function (DUF4261)